MVYTSYSDLVNCIRRNVWKVPSDVDLIVGIPRSGMIPTLMIAELLHKPCADLDSFIDGRLMRCGRRERIMRQGDVKKVLVLDDTVWVGNAMRRAKACIERIAADYDIIYGCIYAEGKDAKSMVDIYFEDIYREGEHTWLYEWNILHHYEHNTKKMMFDIDGVLCKEPPDERDRDAYETYLPNAIPMVIPTTLVGALVTYRLEKYRTATEAWMSRHGVSYGKLIMHNAPDYDTRRASESPAQYKARIYSNETWAVLFVESSARQSEQIFKLTGKPVFCYENGKMYK